LLFTISEEVGSGASAVLHGDVAEMVTVDTGPVAPIQVGDEFGVTVCMKDSTGPFDYHLTHKLLSLCQDYGIRHQRDVFRHYRCDSASAIEAGNDIRTALVCFGTDATHGYERCHLRALQALGELLCLYVQSPPTARRDRVELGSPDGFTHLPVAEG
jgi:putative aminopeptidase FrvX